MEGWASANWFKRDMVALSLSSVCQSNAFVGSGRFKQMVYAAKKIYDVHRKDLERERTDDEFMAMYEQYEAFDELEDEFLEKEEGVYGFGCKLCR